MTYRVFHWAGEEPYVDRNERARRGNLQKPTRTPSNIYPWHKMVPGDNFYVPANLNDKNAVHALKNKIYNSAKAFKIHIKIYSCRIDDDNFGLKVIHDGVVK